MLLGRPHQVLRQRKLGNPPRNQRQNSVVGLTSNQHDNRHVGPQLRHFLASLFLLQHLELVALSANSAYDLRRHVAQKGRDGQSPLLPPRPRGRPPRGHRHRGHLLKPGHRHQPPMDAPRNSAPARHHGQPPAPPFLASSQMIECHWL